MTKDSPTQPGHAAARAHRYIFAAGLAAVIAVIALPLAGWIRALEFGACVLLVLVPVFLGRDLAAGWFRKRSNLPDCDPNGWPMTWPDPARDAWIHVASPIAGMLASSIPIGLYVLIAHRPLLTIAAVVLCSSASLLAVAPWDDHGRRVMEINPWLWLPGLVSHGSVARWALAVADSPWGLAVALLAVAHICIGLAIPSRARRVDPARPKPSPGWLAAYLGTLLVITGGIAYCIYALA